MGRPGSAVANDDDVRIQRLEVPGGVLQGLAFLERGCLGAKIDHIRGQPQRSQLETDPSPGGRLDEQVDDRLAAQGGNLFDGAFADRLENAGGVENGEDFIGAEGLDVEQMFAVPGHVFSR